MSHLDLVTILCEKLEETKQFYVERLGFSVVDQFSSPTGDFVWLRSERMGTNIALQDVATRAPKITLSEIPVVRGGIMFGFPVENARETLKEWQEAGLPTRTDIFDMKKGETFGAYDPEGNFIQLYDVYPQFREIQRKLGLE
jgi:catechol 2,3-dioxygenase-like lactoylglutathione lyase family enzyme